MSNKLNLTLFNKYADILQPLQICQIGEYSHLGLYTLNDYL